jgi:uncharacterized protein
MKITWDEPKRLANLDKHGLDFANLDDEFFLSAVIRPAKLGRHMAVGQVGGGSTTAIFVRLGVEGLSIISMRPARKSERRFLNANREN